MSDVFTTHDDPDSVADLGKPDGKSMLGNTKSEHIAARSCNDIGNEQGRAQGAAGEGAPQEPSRIRLDVPMGTSYCEIQESIFRQAWQLAGTQLRAAIGLGITPETISRVLRRCDRMRIRCPQVPEAWPVVAPPEPPPAINQVIEGENQPSDQPMSSDGVDDGEARSSADRTLSANEESGSLSAPSGQEELKTEQ